MAQTNEQGKSPPNRVKGVWQTVVRWKPPETIERWLPTITRMAFALVLLYFCLYVLQFVGQAPGIYTGYGNDMERAKLQCYIFIVPKSRFYSILHRFQAFRAGRKSSFPALQIQAELLYDRCP